MTFLLIVCVALLFIGCKRKVIIEGEETRQEAVVEEGQISEEERLAQEREQIEASLQTKGATLRRQRGRLQFSPRYARTC